MMWNLSTSHPGLSWGKAEAGPRVPGLRVEIWESRSKTGIFLSCFVFLFRVIPLNFFKFFSAIRTFFRKNGMHLFVNLCRHWNNSRKQQFRENHHQSVQLLKDRLNSSFDNLPSVGIEKYKGRQSRKATTKGILRCIACSLVCAQHC